VTVVTDSAASYHNAIEAATTDDRPKESGQSPRLVSDEPKGEPVVAIQCADPETIAARFGPRWAGVGICPLRLSRGGNQCSAIGHRPREEANGSARNAIVGFDQHVANRGRAGP
jgi:hypothetical protein